MNHVTCEYLTKMLLDCGLIFFLCVRLHVLCVINITSLCYPVFPICHISAKQLLISIDSIYSVYKHLRCKKVRPSKVESYLEVNT